MIWQLLHLGVNKLIEDLKDLNPVKETVTPDLLKDAAEKLKKNNQQKLPFINEVASGELDVAKTKTKEEIEEERKAHVRQYHKDYYKKNRSRLRRQAHERYMSLTEDQKKELNRKRTLRNQRKKEAELKRQQELEGLTQHPIFRFVKFSD